MKTPSCITSLLASVLLLGHPLQSAADRPPPAGIRGRVVDGSTGAPVISASVSAPGVAATTTRDDGSFELVLPAGTWTLIVQHDVYKPIKVDNVVVSDGFASLELQMTFDEGVVQEVVVEEKMDRRTERTLLEQRKSASVVADAISAQEIARTPDSGAQDSIKRVTSATVSEGRYVMVRGLGGRYTSTLLNGVQLPSSEPDKQAVPLDLFPNALLANLTVSKSWSAGMPGGFGGGSLQINTSSHPAEFELKTKVSLGADTMSSFRTRHANPGRFDFLGVDDGGRALPAEVPGDKPVLAGMNGMEPETVDSIGRSFDNRWSARERYSRPHLGLGLTAGSTETFGVRKLGWLATANYSHKESLQRVRVRSVRDEGGQVTTRDHGTSATGTESASFGALLNGALMSSPDHEVSLLSLYTHTGESKAQVAAGYSDADGMDYQGTRLQFVNRALSFSQLTGRHSLGRVVADWQANVSVTTRDEPDTRDTDYNVLPTGELRFRVQPGSGERFFSTLRDVGTGAGANVTIPSTIATWKAGFSAQRSTREFDARRFRFDFIGDDPDVLFLAPEEMFAPSRIGTDWRLEERTLQADSYDARLDVGAVYAEADSVLSNALPLRSILGARLESSSQRLVPGSRYAVTATPEPEVVRDTVEILPSASLVYLLGNDVNIRLGYSYTIARPQFRELAPFLYSDFAKRRSVSGNPDLVETRIHNADVRWEWFPSGLEVVSAGVFAKQFRHPIEQVIVSATGDLSFANADGATAVGGEVEARKLVGPFRLAGNLSVIESRIDLGRSVAGQTNAKRPLQGLSPFVLNLNAGWAGPAGIDLGLLYNVTGRRIVEVGHETLPDVYEQPFHRLDFVASRDAGHGLVVKAAATNLLDQAVTHQAGGIETYRWRPGIGGTLTLEWKR